VPLEVVLLSQCRTATANVLDRLRCMLREQTFITAIHTHDVLLVASCDDNLVLYSEDEALRFTKQYSCSYPFCRTNLISVFTIQCVSEFTMEFFCSPLFSRSFGVKYRASYSSVHSCNGV
jgi:hypothetical protein